MRCSRLVFPGGLSPLVLVLSNQQEDLLKHKYLGCTSRVSDSVGLGGRVPIINTHEKFQVMLMLLVL